MSFLLSLIGLLSLVQTEIIWQDDQVDIPLHADLNQYIDIPNATLYIDGKPTIDPLMYYERNGVERTFLSTVQTGVVRSYSIKYRVNFPTYHLSSVHTITFHVKDMVAPIFLFVPSFELPLGSKAPYYVRDLIIEDNYDHRDSLLVTVDDSQVMLNRPGTYKVTFRIQDTSFNITTSVTLVTVFDPFPPTITMIKPLILSHGSMFEWHHYFSIKDNVDQVIEVIVDDHDVNYDVLGSYPIRIVAKDSSNLQTEGTYMMTIIDDQAPMLRVIGYVPVINIGNPVDDGWLRSLILGVEDNMDVLTIDDVSILSEIEYQYPGTYRVYYEVKDDAMNVSKASVSVQVKDIEKPVVTRLHDLVFDVHGDPVSWLECFMFSDNHDDASQLTYKITQSVKFDKIGHYPISVELTDQAGNKTLYQDYVAILDRTPPTIEQTSDILITTFERPDLMAYVKISDQYHPKESLNLEIDDDGVSYDQTGTYQVTYQATDPSGNLQTLVVEVMVIDIEPPTLRLKTNHLTVDIGSEPWDLVELIYQVSDNHDDLSIDDVIIEGLVDYDRIGRYTLTYRLSDASMNPSEQELIVIVDDRKPPWIIASDLEVNQYDICDPMTGITYGDEETASFIHVLPTTIDTTSPGRKIVTYLVIDQRGNQTTLERAIDVLPMTTTYEWTDFIPLAVMTLVGAIGMYVFYKKR